MINDKCRFCEKTMSIAKTYNGKAFSIQCINNKCAYSPSYSYYDGNVFDEKYRFDEDLKIFSVINRKNNSSLTLNVCNVYKGDIFIRDINMINIICLMA